MIPAFADVLDPSDASCKCEGLREATCQPRTRWNLPMDSGIAAAMLLNTLQDSDGKIITMQSYVTKGTPHSIVH